MSFFEDLRLHYRDQPHEVSLETFSHCNAKCTFCPYTTLERIGTKMPDELIARLIDEMATFELPFYFSPFKVNEPLLDKRFISICKTFNEKCPKGYLRIFSNGSTLTEKNVDGIAGLNRVVHLWVSLNTHRPVEHQELMGLDFDQTAKKLDALHVRRSKDFPHEVVVSRVGKDDDFVRYVHWRWPNFRIATLKRDAWIDFTHADELEVPDKPCGRWWELNISATGQESLCCMDSKAEYGWGNIHHTTLREMYAHPMRKRWRDEALNRTAAGSPCSTCTY